LYSTTCAVFDFYHLAGPLFYEIRPSLTINNSLSLSPLHRITHSSSGAHASLSLSLSPDLSLSFSPVIGETNKQDKIRVS